MKNFQQEFVPQKITIIFVISVFDGRRKV